MTQYERLSEAMTIKPRIQIDIVFANIFNFLVLASFIPLYTAANIYMASKDKDNRKKGLILLGITWLVDLARITINTTTTTYQYIIKEESAIYTFGDLMMYLIAGIPLLLIPAILIALEVFLYKKSVVARENNKRYKGIFILSRTIGLFSLALTVSMVGTFLGEFFKLILY